MWAQKRFPRENANSHDRVIYILCALSVAFFVLWKFLPQKGPDRLRNDMVQASKLMEDATDALKACRQERGLSLDRSTDINGTGLIGMENSAITTSMGNLGSKRTSTNPNLAGLVVRLLGECDVREGDCIAVGASGSFPALIIASLAALETLGLDALWISSLGASQWGANHPRFHWIHMWRCLEQSGLFSQPPLVLSLGGEGDMGEDMDESGRQLLWDDLHRSELLSLNEPDFARNVALRMEIYERAANAKKIKAFINIGGSWANMGNDSMVLHLRPGLNLIDKFPPPERRGVLYEMAARGIPVIHLLYMRGLIDRYGLEWDPSPLPSPGEGALYRITGERQEFILGWGAAYIILVFLVLATLRKRKSGIDKT
ncbi:MAG: poly-gamma-glutamate system protein [Candidatus Aminicenantes bacterium]